MCKQLCLVFLVLTPLIGFSQITTTNIAPYNTEEFLVNDVFLGGDIVTGNFSSVGFGAGIGYFDGTDANIGFEEGVILSSGGVNFVTGGFGAGSGVSGDADLELALNEINLTWGVNNVTILEFDFVAESESVAFNYVFASQEYSEFTCTQYNDIFGFFLSGPGIVGPYSNNGVNIALIPDPDNPGDYTNTPIAVNTVNSGFPTGGGDAITCSDIDPDWESYNVYWIDNDYNIPLQDWEGVNQPEEPQLTVESVTGFTTPLVATYNGLVCGETYHIKLAIADAFDSQLNSVVFLEANSFTSPSVVVNPIPNINGPDLFDDPDAINEGCAAAQLEFNSTGNVDYDVILGVEFGGDAELGVDYQATQEDDSELDICFNPDDGSLFPCLTIPAGQETFYINIEAFYDDNPEVVEELEIVLFAVSGVCQQAELAVSEVSFNLYDQIPITPNPVDPVVIACFGDQAILESPITVGGYIGDSGSYTFSWFDLDGNLIGDGASVEVSTSEDGQYELVVQDDCQDQSVSLDYFVEVIEYPIIEMEPLSFEVCYGDIVSMTPAISGGSGDYIYTWPDNSTSPSFEYLFSLAGGPSQDVLFNILDNCTNESFDFSVSITLIDQPDILMDPLSYTACYGDLITITPQISGGSGAYTFDWFDNSNLATFDYNFELSSGSIQNVDFNVIDDCTNESFPFSIEVNVEDQPDILMDPLSFEVCYGDIVSMTPFISGGSGDYNYTWPDNSTSPSFEYLFSLAGGPSQDVLFNVLDNCTNESFDFSVSITLIDQPDILMDPLSYTACYGDLITITPQISGGSGAYTFDWSDNSNLVTFDYNFELSSGSIQNVDFNVIDDCTNEAFPFSIEVNLEDQPDILMDPLSYTACYGDIIAITPQISGGSGDYSYIWPDSPIACACETFDYNFELSGGATQTIDFEVIDNCTNESFTLSVDITLEDQSNILMEPLSYTACYGDLITITPQISGGSGLYTIFWESFDFEPITGSIIQTTGVSYDYTFELSGGSVQNVNFNVIDDCTNESFLFSVAITLEDQSNILMEPLSYTACYGDVITINPQVSEGSGAYTFVWPDNSNAEVFNFSFDAVSGAIQNVDFNVIDDCTNETFAFTAELNLDSTLSPSVNFIKEDQFCPGDPMVISVIADGSSTYTYEWYDASNTQIGSGLSVTVSPSQDTSYFVKVIDDCNIFTWDFPISVQIPIYNSPSFSLPSFIGCVGDEVEITIENLQAEAINNIDNPQNDLTFFWSASCDNCVSSTEPSIIVTIQEETIEYFVEVTDLCGNTTLTSGLINPAIVEPSLPPPPEFTFDQLTNGVQFQLTANTLNSFDEYDWDFGDGNNSVEPEPFHTYTEEGIYDVELKAYDSLRCENNFKGVVNIFSQLLLYTPDVFSPNGDGVNDSFRVSVVGAESFELLVYDRWGHQLFYTKNPKEGWDGKYPNGILAPQDVYLYKVLYSNKSNDNKVKQGKVAIVK